MAGEWRNKNGKSQIENLFSIVTLIVSLVCGGAVLCFLGFFFCLWTVQLCCVLSHCLPVLFRADPLALLPFKLSNLRLF